MGLSFVECVGSCKRRWWAEAHPTLLLGRSHAHAKPRVGMAPDLSGGAVDGGAQGEGDGVGVGADVGIGGDVSLLDGEGAGATFRLKLPADRGDRS